MKISIIGGGLSGLATAALLAKQGHEVDLYEKNSGLGGRAQKLVTKGFVFDMGPSWYLMPEVMENLFSELGEDLSQYLDLVELKPKYRVFSDTYPVLDLESDEAKNLAKFKEMAPTDEAGIKKVIKTTAEIYESVVNKLLIKPYRNISDFIGVTELVEGSKLLLRINPFQSYHSYVQRHIKHPLLQKVFEFHTVFLGGDPYKTPALYSMLIAADFKKKVWYPQGGMYQLVAALEKVCRKNGVKVHLNSPVSQILIEENKVVGLEVNGKKQKADAVVSAADMAFTDLKLLPKKHQEYSAEYWQSRDYAISTILVYLGVGKKLRNLKHHNFYFQDDWNQHFQTIEKTSQLPAEPCFYLGVTSKTDPSVAPKGQENLFLLIPTSIKTSNHNLDKYVDQVLQHVEQKIGEKFVDQIVYKKVFAQQDFVKEYNAFQGNALGLAHTLDQTLFLRPRMKSKKVKDLYYVGQFVQPGVGVPMVLLSAQYLVNYILKSES